MYKFVLISAVCVGVAWGYSSGAPEGVCEDMTPKHPVEPQKSPFPYTVSVNPSKIKTGQKVKITLGGGKPFMGHLLQVRDGNKAVGTFHLLDDSSKTINCFESKQNAITHTSKIDKKEVVVEWIPPNGEKKTYTVYATVAENGGVFWVHKPTASITVE